MKKLILTLSAACMVTALHAEEKKLELTGNDQMQYSTKTLEVTAGDKVTLTLKHIGQIPKTAMGHNVVILKAGTPVPTFATKAMTAAATDYIPADEESKKLIVAHTKVVGGGESDTITFTAPAEAGDYPYLCTFPGHFALMQGVLKVKAKE
ncbi:azurin [Haloferula sp. BvORR071]|uniref:azurin n=1 Tax=Haloferula sp. BvORR071 TaxID=1396141 RepID=UPI000696142C|nr:azurin [Haloferula sp. BvORR071]